MTVLSLQGVKAGLATTFPWILLVSTWGATLFLCMWGRWGRAPYLSGSGRIRMVIRGLIQAEAFCSSVFVYHRLSLFWRQPGHTGGGGGGRTIGPYADSLPLSSQFQGRGGGGCLGPAEEEGGTEPQHIWLKMTPSSR